MLTSFGNILNPSVSQMQKAINFRTLSEAYNICDKTRRRNNHIIKHYQICRKNS